MKTIYMESTLNLIPLEQAKELASRGELRNTEKGINYLKIEENGE